MLKLYPSPSFKATGACKLYQGTQVQLYNSHTAYSENKLETSVMGPELNHVVDGGSSLLWHRLRQFSSTIFIIYLFLILIFE